MIKNLPVSARDRRHRLDPWVGKIPRKRKYQPNSSSLPWEIAWTKEPGGLQSMGSQRVRHDLAMKHAHNIKAYKYIKQILTDIKGEI